LINILINAQVSINTDGTTPHPSAQLEVKSTKKGLLLPRVNTPSTTIANPAAGLLVYDQTAANPSYFNGSQWQNISGNESLYARFPNSTGYFGKLNNSGQPNQVIITGLTVPAGITKMWVEMWAGGDAGSFLAAVENNPSGGDAGDFASFIMDVIPNEPITLAIGNGGEGFSNSIAGITTVGTQTAGIYSVFQASRGLSYNGILATAVPGLLNYVSGEKGQRCRKAYNQLSSILFVTLVSGGIGGNSYPNQKGSIDIQATYNSSTLDIISRSNNIGGNGQTPGGGGGVGYLY
jgi:hypothetical protein